MSESDLVCILLWKGFECTRRADSVKLIRIVQSSRSELSSSLQITSPSFESLCQSDNPLHVKAGGKVGKARAHPHFISCAHSSSMENVRQH